MSKKLKFPVIAMIIVLMLFSTIALACGGNENADWQYDITIVSGKSSVSTAVAGTTVTLTASNKTGYTFTEWTTDAAGLVITDNSFVMPASDVTITANYIINSYSLTVNDGTAKIGGTEVTGKVKYGTEVTLTADEPEIGFIQNGWNCSDVNVSDDKFSMPAKDVTVSANYEKEFPTLTIAAEKGVTFAGGKTTADVKRDDPLPEVVNNKAGVDIAGFYDTSDESVFWNQSSYVLRDRNSNTSSGAKNVTAFAMPAKDTTVAPVFVKEGHRPLIPSSQAIDAGDIQNVTRVGTKIYETNIGTQIGAELTYNGVAYTGPTTGALSGTGYFRMLTSCATSGSNPGALMAGSHTFYYWFKNLGADAIKFTAYQGNSGTNIYGNTGTITLAPGETWSGTVTVELPNGNGNALTLIAFDESHAEKTANFAMVMSKSPENDVIET